ncbi:MAG TPA: Hsp20/alpha crystallin family protein [Candidatus Limnocylindrales bacterium]|nr:Hsp20/alpha crystallin family protein [Candidatus Limnocylindrales bacterium]
MFNELMRWNPSEELSNWHRDIDDLFGRFFGRTEAPAGGWMPRLETCRKDNNYVVRIDLPGVDPRNLSVQAEGNVLTISGERKSADTHAEYRETSYGKFERALTLPQGVETDKIAAHYENGVLEVTVPLPPQLAGRKIPVQIEQKENKKIESKAA